MKRMRKQLPAFLLAIIFCLSLLPGTAWAANFPSMFYASVTYKYESNTKYEIFGTVTQSADTLTYSRTGEKMDRVVYGMEYAGGVFFTVEGNKLPRNEDDGLRELRMYNSDLTSYRTIGTVNQANGGYWIVDTAMDLSGEEPALYGTYQSGGFVEGAYVGDCPYICKIDLTSGKTSNWLQVTGLESEKNDIIYAMAFDQDGTLYAIGADKADDGGKASLYTIDLNAVQDGAYGVKTVQAHKIAAITSQTGNPIYTNFAQDLAFDHATSTLYWMENKSEVLYTLNTESAEATSVGKTPALQSFCIPYDTAFEGNKHMVSVICEGAGTVTSNNASSPFYMVDNGDDITLNITPNTGSGLRYVKVDGSSIPTTNLVENGYTFENVTENHVIEVGFKLAIPAEQHDMTWFHYQGEPASFYTQHHVYKFYDLPYLDKEAPREDYVQTLLDENGQDIDDDEIILPGNYDVHVTHPGNADYAALDVTYKDGLQLAKCPGTPGRPVVYGKVGCTQGDLSTTSALQDYYGADGTLIDAAHDEIPVTLVWQNPEITYDEAGNFYASATIYAGELSEHILACYNLDDGTALTEGCQISARATQVVVLAEDKASLIKLLASDASGGTVSGKGVYKNGDTVTVTATVNANDGYEFKGWQENGEIISGAGETYTFEASGDRTLTAVFEVDEDYRVTLKTDPADGGTVTGGGSYEDEPHSATVTATANKGYYFMGWYNGETQASTENPYTFTVNEEGITLTAKFGIDYLARAEQAKENFASALGTDMFEWQTLEAAVDAYKAAEEFVNDDNLPEGVKDAEDRFNTLTTYYNDIQALDLSDQNIDNDDLAELKLFTGLTDLNLSGNRGVTSLAGLEHMTQLETLDISGTGVTTLDSLITEGQSNFPGYKNLTAQNLSLTSLSVLVDVINAEGFSADSVTKWDFTGSTLTDTEDNKADVAAIQNVLNVEIQKFIPPTIQAPPTGGGGGGATTYAVTVEKAEHGKVTASPSSASSGTPVTITVTPDEGYELEKLTVTDSKGSEVKLTDKGNGKYTFDMPNSEVEIKAVFRKIAPVWENCPGGVDCPAYSYRDVDTSAWYHEAVDYVLVNGLMSGYGNGVFGPNDHLSRAQLCQILYNKEGRPAVTGSSVFTDVVGTAWYADAVIWANTNGVVGGYGGGVFGPDDPITREQLAAILWRYAGSPESSHSLDAFTDAGQISDWAMDAMRWANENGVLNGDGSGHLIPRGNATRAHVAQMIQNFLENIGA